MSRGFTKPVIKRPEVKEPQVLFYGRRVKFCPVGKGAALPTKKTELEFSLRWMASA